MTRFTFEGTINQDPTWTPDGKRIAFRSNKESAAARLFWQMADGSGGLERLTTGEYQHNARAWSPDGQLLAFQENHPSTSRDMWVLRLTQPEFSAGKPRVLFEGEYFASVFPQTSTTYDVSPDGQRFLMAKETARTTAPVQINVVLNWFEELKRRVPTN